MRVHLLAAALIWSLVGALLMSRGFQWLTEISWQWLALPALALGTLKGLFILDGVARKNIERIRGMQDGACIGAVYSLKTWGLVVLMIALGRLVRSALLPRELVGPLYLAIGWALFWASRLIWRAWYVGTKL